MYLFKEVEHKQSYTGKLAVLEQTDDSPVYVIYEVSETNQTVMLVELDRPQENVRIFDLNDPKIYVLEPLDVVERVQEWK